MPSTVTTVWYVADLQVSKHESILQSVEKGCEWCEDAAMSAARTISLLYRLVLSTSLLYHLVLSTSEASSDIFSHQ